MEKGIAVVRTFIELVDYLSKVVIKDGSNIYMETRGGKLRNFSPSDFRLRLGQLFPKRAQQNEFLSALKTLGLIVARDGNFTNLQRINGRMRRVISVDMEKHGYWKSGKIEKKKKQPPKE